MCFFPTDATQKPHFDILENKEFVFDEGFRTKRELNHLSGQRFSAVHASKHRSWGGWSAREASEEASLLFRPSWESLCLPSSLDILVSAKENK